MKKKITLSYALITLAVLTAFLLVSLLVLNIPIVIALFLSWIILACFALGLGYTLSEIESSAADMIKFGAGVFPLLLAIGCMVSIWLCSGAVPTLIYWGLKLITPRMFLFLAFVICAVVSIPTGTSWGTMGTVGVAMFGVGVGFGIKPALVVGAIVAGAHVGDCFSPASDIPLLTSTVCGVSLSDHVKHSIKSVAPAFLIASVIYLILGLTSSGATTDTSALSGMIADLESNMKLSVLTLLPIVVVIVLLVMRQSSLWAILAGCIVGGAIAVFYQGYSVTEVGTFMASGFKIETGNTYLDPILNRGGLNSMLELVSIALIALGMGGILKGMNVLDIIVESMSHKVRNTKGLTAATAIGDIACQLMVSTGYFAITIVGTLITPLYNKLGYKSVNASRAISNLNSAFCVFVPWALTPLIIVSYFGVPIISIMPYVFFNIALIVVELFYGFTGIAMEKEVSTDKESA